MKDKYDEGLHMAQLYHKLKSSRHGRSAIAMNNNTESSLLDRIEKDHAQSIKDFYARHHKKQV